MFQSKWLISLILCAFYITPVLALDSDQKEPLHIKSDSFIYNYKSGMDVYEGNVMMDQGTTHITADKLITKKNASHKIREAIAHGNLKLAHYWTIPELNKPELHTHAKTIKFYPTENKVVFEEDVLVTQGENRFQGALVLYNRKDNIITVPPLLNAKAVLIYNPDE